VDATAGTAITETNVSTDMGLKTVLLALGVLELLIPRAIVDFWMNLAVEDDSDVKLRPWVYRAARLEGLLIVLWVLTRREDESE
jgi:hypothetical protein